MKGWLYKVWSAFLVQFSKLKVLSFNFIPILAYDPVEYHVTGSDILQVMELLRPGDVLLRGYDKYLDVKFIPDDLGYCHAGIYVGGTEVIHAASPTVHRTNVIDFCECDRLMVLRPNGLAGQAVALAESLIGVPYDFNYEGDSEKLYCFELVSKCYPSAQMQTHPVSKFLGLVRRTCYLASSIYANPFFQKVWEKNDRSN